MDFNWRAQESTSQDRLQCLEFYLAAATEWGDDPRWIDSLKTKIETLKREMNHAARETDPYVGDDGRVYLT